MYVDDVKTRYRLLKMQKIIWFLHSEAKEKLIEELLQQREPAPVWIARVGAPGKFELI